MATTHGRRNPSKFNPFLAVLLVLVAVVGTLVTLEATGKTNFGLASLWEVQAADTNAGTIGVIMSVRALQPGDQIDLPKVIDPLTRTLRYAPAELEMANEKSYATRYSLIKGRVLARPKAPDEPFVPDDFLPKGSPPGLVGLIPAGMELLMLDVDSVQGLEVLGFQNRFDLKSSEPVDAEIKKAAEAAVERGKSSSPTERIRLAATSRISNRRVLAQNGMILRPARQGVKNGAVAVALHPDDIGPIMDALGRKETIYCIARAANGEGAAERVAYAEKDPIEDYQWLLDSRREVEVYKGNNRSLGIVPLAKQP